MVNRDKRRIASDLIHRLLAGEITNDAFESQFPSDTSDPALAGIYEHLWFYWDGRKTHSLTGEHILNDEIRAVFTRCRAFLQSDMEYEWPSMSRAPIMLILLRLFGSRKAVEKREQEEMERIRSFGDFEVWPFARLQDLDRD